jgi:hypothetical protein
MEIAKPDHHEQARPRAFNLVRLGEQRVRAHREQGSSREATAETATTASHMSSTRRCGQPAVFRPLEDAIPSGRF